MDKYLIEVLYRSRGTYDQWAASVGAAKEILSRLYRLRENPQPVDNSEIVR